MKKKYAQIIPEKHSACKQTFEIKTVQVDPRVLTVNPYPVEYCPRCNVYSMGGFETSNPEKMGNHITAIQVKANLSSHESAYNIPFLRNNGYMD